ncbi:hypothetical protein BDM02DRAFT_3243768, partial [Thelephora ganbajun]
TWFEEFESSDSSSTRPSITEILKQLQDEAKNWSPTSRLLAPQIPMERKASSASSFQSSRFPDRLMAHTGYDFEDVAAHDDGAFYVNFDDILKEIDCFIGPEGAEPRQTVVQSQAHSPSHHHIPLPLSPAPQVPPVLPRTKKGSVSKAWSKLKRLFTKKLGEEDQVPPKLSDRLVPERDDKWYEPLFSKDATQPIRGCGYHETIRATPT